MILFELIRLIVLAMPLGIFLTFGILVVVALFIGYVKLKKVFKYVLFFYCLSATIVSFLLLTYYYYYYPIFEQFDILYGTSVIFAIVLFHHMLCITINFEKPFSIWHYLTVAFVCIVMLLFKLLFAELWKAEGARVLLVAAFIIGVIHSLLTLIKIHEHQLTLSMELNTPDTIDKPKAIPFIVEILLFPWVFAACPLLTGQNPGVLTSLILMASIGMALRMNIPLTYAIIRHYATPFNETSLLASIPSDKMELLHTHVVLQKESHQKKETENNEDPLSEKLDHAKNSSSKKSKNIRKKVIEIDKKKFEDYMKIHKPYLNPNLTMQDLAILLDSNRTYISQFVNRVYNMNFNAYINHCRLCEVKRLLALPANKGKDASKLVKQAGFTTHRNYLRAQKIEEENKKLNKEIKTHNEESGSL